MECSKQMHCFETGNLTIMNEKRKNFIAAAQADCRKKLNSMAGSDKHFYFDGRKVFRSFLSKIFRFSNDLEMRAKMSTCVYLGNKPSTTQFNSLPGSGALSSCAERTTSIISFLERLADSSGNCMLDRSERHVPFLLKRKVYEQFLKEYSILHSDSPPSSAYFVRLLKKDSSEIKV